MKREIGFILSVICTSAIILTGCGSAETVDPSGPAGEQVSAEDKAAEESTEINKDEMGASSAGSGSEESAQGSSTESSGESPENGEKTGKSKEIPELEGTGTDEDPKEVEESFKAEAVKEAGAKPEEARYTLTEDMDGDGYYEGFVFIGDKADEEWGAADGSVWYVNGRECREIHKRASIAVNEDGSVFGSETVSGRKFVMFNERYATSDVSFIFYVEDSECRESAVSGVGSADLDPSSGELYITVSAYDSFCDYDKDSDEPLWTGHTWKPYYFHYDEKTGDFEEYAARSITEEELKNICGIDLAGEIRDKGYSFDGAMERKNGIVNVNYSKEEENPEGGRSVEYKNATFSEKGGVFADVWGKGDNSWESSDYGGTYAEKLIN